MHVAPVQTVANDATDTDKQIVVNELTLERIWRELRPRERLAFKEAFDKIPLTCKVALQNDFMIS